jgi:hypothetical protein
MQQPKEIASLLEKKNYSLDNIILSAMKNFNLKSLCASSGIQKKAGVNAFEIVSILLMLPLMKLESVHQFYKSAYSKVAEMKKDTIYRLKNNENYPWRKLLMSIAKSFKKLKPLDNTEAKRITALILDDTIDARTGWKIENITYVFDHTLRKSVLGFKNLVLAYFDGTMTIPVDFSLHGEKNLPRAKASKQYKKKVDPKSPGWIRRSELHKSKINQGIDMIKRAVKNGFSVDYILCDSWFTSLDFIKAVRALKSGAIHIIAGVRADKRKYSYDGELFDAKSILNHLKSKSKQKRCRSLNILYYEAAVEYEGIGKVKLVMCRYPGQKNNRFFITTDINLSFIEMMRIYGIRWTIEVMFKELKQYLQLGSCQSQDFDAQISSATISMILYILLAHIKRRESYTTVGELFRLVGEDLTEKNLAERLWALFEELLQLILDKIGFKQDLELNKLLQTPEFLMVKQMFSSSFLSNQLADLCKPA